MENTLETHLFGPKPCDSPPKSSYLPLEVGFTAGLEGLPSWLSALSLWRHMGAMRAPADATALTALVGQLRPAGEWLEALGLCRAALRRRSADVTLLNAVCSACVARQVREIG